MDSMNMLGGKMLLVMVIAGRIGVMGTHDGLFASTAQSIVEADQANASIQTTRNAPQIPSANPSTVSQSASPTLRPAGNNRRPSLEDRVKTLAASLNLSDAQQSAVKNILIQRQREILRIRLDPSMTGGAGIDRFRALQEITVWRIRAVLNEEQRKKYDPLAVRKKPQTPQPSVEDWLKAMTPH